MRSCSKLLQSLDLRSYEFPFRDGGIPDNMADAAQFVKDVIQWRASHRTVQQEQFVARFRTQESCVEFPFPPNVSALPQLARHGQVVVEQRIVGPYSFFMCRRTRAGFGVVSTGRHDGGVDAFDIVHVHDVGFHELSAASTLLSLFFLASTTFVNFSLMAPAI